MEAGCHDPFNQQSNFHFDNMYFQNPQKYGSILLYQVGDLSCKKGYVVGEHKQFCYEISYIVSGKGIFYMNGRAYAVQEGDMILNVPGQLHDCVADPADPFRYFYMGFDFLDEDDEPYSLAHIQKMFDQTKFPVIPDKCNIDVPFVSIFKEILHLKRDSWFMIAMYLRQIIILAHRNFHENWTVAYWPDLNMDEPRRKVYEVINYIDAHLHQITELARIADELHYSYTYLSHLFSKEIGCTIQEYYNRRRFEKAVEWLKSGELNITQIAEKLRYRSIHSFSKAFRKHYGFSPTEYQSLLHAEEES